MIPSPVNRDRVLRVLGVTAEQWCARYGIEPFSVTCDCGATRTTTIPWALGPQRGLIAPLCVCGTEDAPYCAVLIDRLLPASKKPGPSP